MQPHQRIIYAIYMIIANIFSSFFFVDFRLPPLVCDTEESRHESHQQQRMTSNRRHIVGEIDNRWQMIQHPAHVDASIRSIAFSTMTADSEQSYKSQHSSLSRVQRRTTLKTRKFQNFMA